MAFNKASIIKTKKKSILFFLIYFIYSLSGVVAKLASYYEIFSFRFNLCYMGMLGIMLIYAIAWQQLLKENSLSHMFMYKSTTIIWANIFGLIFFDERISLTKLIGILCIVMGISILGEE